jgi:hypothetical protein
MSPHRCQVCNRRKGLRNDGGVVMHYVGGEPCEGVGFPPIELSDAQLEAAAERARKMADDFYERQAAADREHAEKRLNSPLDPQRYGPWIIASRRALRLHNRLTRWRSRERRRERQLATYGYTL